MKIIVLTSLKKKKVTELKRQFWLKKLKVSSNLVTSDFGCSGAFHSSERLLNQHLVQTSPFLLVSGWRNPEDTAEAEMARGSKFRLMGAAAGPALPESQSGA